MLKYEFIASNDMKLNEIQQFEFESDRPIAAKCQSLQRILKNAQIHFLKQGECYVYYGLASPGQWNTPWRLRYGTTTYEKVLGSFFFQLAKTVSGVIEEKTGVPFYYSQIFQNMDHQGEKLFLAPDDKSVVITKSHVDSNPGRVALFYGNMHSDGGLWVCSRGVFATQAKIIVGPFNRLPHAKVLSGGCRLVLVLRLGSKFGDQYEPCPKNLYDKVRSDVNLPPSQQQLNKYIDSCSNSDEIIVIDWMNEDFFKIAEARKNSVSETSEASVSISDNSSKRKRGTAKKKPAAPLDTV